MSQLRITACMIAIALALASLAAQRSGSSSGGGGTGRASDSVLGTWEASGQQNMDTLDLLVLWRGHPGWWAKATDIAVGGSDHLHRLKADDAMLELRFDPAARVVRVQGQTVSLGDNNVVMVDGVDTPNRLTVVGTMRVDPRFPNPASGDPVEQIVKQSPGLSEFAR
jgi:hypothetical protein